MAAAVCICLQSAFDSGLLNEPRLLELAAAAELRVRKVTTAVADLMVCKAGSTLAFMLWRGGAAADDTAVRVARMAGSFKQAYVLVPHEHLRTPAVLEAAASFGCDEALSFVFLPMGADFADRAIALATALLPAEAEAALWRTQQAEVVATSDAVNQALLGLPLPADGDGAHHANMLRMLGSLQDISQRRGEEIAAHTDLDAHTAAGVAAFFQRGARGTEPQLVGQLQSL